MFISLKYSMVNHLIEDEPSVEKNILFNPAFSGKIRFRNKSIYFQQGIQFRNLYQRVRLNLAEDISYSPSSDFTFRSRRTSSSLVKSHSTSGYERAERTTTSVIFFNSVWRVLRKFLRAEYYKTNS